MEGILGKVMIPAVVAPILAFVVGGLAIVVRSTGSSGGCGPGPSTGGFRLGQVLSGGLLALAHGTNDAQKTMGVITLALVANGTISESNFHVPDWVVVSSATAIALGTYVGGWRIIKTMGSRIHKMDAAQGFAAQGSGATVILAASHVGFPLSTTHTISGAVIGSGAAKRLSAVRWGVAGNIVVAWILTLPGAALIGGLTYLVTRAFGTGAVGPIVVSAAIVVGGAMLFARRSREGAAPGVVPATGSAAVVIATIVDWDAIAPGDLGVAARRGGGDRGLGLRDRGRHAARSSAAATGAGAAAVVYAIVGVAGFAIVLGAIVFGIVILTGD